MNFPPPLTLHDENEEHTFMADIVGGIACKAGGRTFRIFPIGSRQACEPSRPVTHRVTQLGQVAADLYSCVMRGSDGSKLTIYLSDDDIRHNIQMAMDAVTTIQHSGAYS